MSRGLTALFPKWGALLRSPHVALMGISLEISFDSFNISRTMEVF